VDSALEAKTSLRKRLKLQTARLAEAVAAALRWRAELQSAREAAASGVAFEVEQRRLAEVKAAQDKEKRVEHLTGMAARRMGKKELAMGWQAWSELYHEKVHQRNLLKKAGARLTKPKLIIAYAQWHADWRDGAAAHTAALAAATQSQRLATETLRAAQAEAALAEVQAELGRARKALAASGDQVELRRQMEEQMAAEKEVRVEHLAQMAGREGGREGGRENKDMEGGRIG